MPGEVLELTRTRNAVQKRTPAPHPTSKSKAMKLLFLIYHPPFRIKLSKTWPKRRPPIIVTIWPDDIVAGVTVFHAQRKLFLVLLAEHRRCKITVRPSLKFNNY
jgi:hypothetical protein